MCPSFAKPPMAIGAGVRMMMYFHKKETKLMVVWSKNHIAWPGHPEHQPSRLLAFNGKYPIGGPAFMGYSGNMTNELEK
jgi:hypothetical protein